ncbi:MAG TPA: hypothetical protein DCE18_16955 [Syntrophobacteraceae bacterium]|nr:hypothetical protein [Syntrophobacteraceae bacterium]HBZ54779.1 hypothetical protein [Syntrophobacteraceae bacterium]
MPRRTKIFAIMMIPRMPSYRWLVVVLWFLLGTWSCALIRPVPEYRPYPLATELLAELHARAAYWQTFQAQAAIRIQSSGGNYRLQAFLTVSPPERLRFEATNPAGQIIWSLIINAENATLWLPTEGVCYHARSGETILRHFAGTPIQPAVFAYGFVGVVPLQHLDAPDFQLVDRNGLVLGRHRDPSRQWQFTWELAPQPAALQALEAGAQEGFEADGASVPRQYAIRFEPSVMIQPQTSPQKVVISTPKWQLEGMIKQLVRLESVPAHIFDPLAVPGIKNVDLDKP